MAEQVWTIKRMLDWTVGYLERKGDERPRLSAEWLISAVTGLSRVELYMSFDRPLDAAELARMHVAVERRGKGEPLQYVTGEMPFRHLVVRCEEGVLIPRPETEILVDAALEGVDAAIAAGQVFDDVARRAKERARAEAAEAAEATEEKGEAGEGAPESLDAADYIEGPEDSLEAAALARLRAERGIDDAAVDEEHADEASAATTVAPQGPRVLDLCTGTGCIALSMAGERPGTFVVATDISDRAVSLAGRNRDALGLEDAVEIYECDLAAAVSDELMGTFSVLVSNPPYIPTSVLPVLPEEVAGFEPRLALDGGTDGLDLFRRILEIAPRALASGGWLCVELFEDALAQAADMVRAQAGWARVEVREDLTHRPRILVAVRA